VFEAACDDEPVKLIRVVDRQPQQAACGRHGSFERSAPVPGASRNCTAYRLDERGR
jgi:hypothetical protein